MVSILKIMMLCGALWTDCSLAQQRIPSIDLTRADGVVDLETHAEIIKPNKVNNHLRSGESVTKEVSAKPFVGEWDKPSMASNGTFSISLAQTDSTIIGQYCAVTKNGHKIDCDVEKNPNITGIVDGRSGRANLTFSSFFGATTGKATITLQNGQLIWHIIEVPRGEFYAPLNAVLLRK